MTMLQQRPKRALVLGGGGARGAYEIGVWQALRELDFQIQAVTEGREAMGDALVKLRHGGKLYPGHGLSTDIIGASIQAYLHAVNKIVYEEQNV